MPFRKEIKYIMKTLKRFFLLLLAIELILVGFYCAFQPQCEPCLPNEFCLPCQSKTQITIQTLALIPIYIGALIFLYRKPLIKYLKLK